MPLTAIGHVYLGGVQFTSDPADLTIEAPARGTTLQTLDGGLYEDVGRLGKGTRIRLSSGPNQLMSASVKTAIEAMVAAPQTAVTYSDFTGLTADVVIERFAPKATFIPDGESGLFYTYELELVVVDDASAIGNVSLDGVTFSTDPQDLAFEQAPRISYLQTIGGGVYQDFGRVASDGRIRLSSGDQLISETVKEAIEARAAVKGVAYAYSDITGRSATVVILRFRPKPTFRRGASGELYYAYELELGVVS